MAPCKFAGMDSCKPTDQIILINGCGCVYTYRQETSIAHKTARLDYDSLNFHIVKLITCDQIWDKSETWMTQTKFQH